MSEAEDNREELKEEIDDLFGDEEEDEEQQQQQQQQQQPQSPQQNETFDGSDGEGEGEGGNEDVRGRINFDQSGSEEEDYEGELTEKNILELSLPRHAQSSLTEGTQILRTPVHLNIEPHPFDPTVFKEEVENNALERVEKGLTSKQIYNEQLAEKLINESTVRWRYHNSGNDEIVKQSNAHFVQWDDGSLSLKIGEEMFDVKKLPTVDNFLVKSYKTAEILQTDSIIENTINLLPASNDSIHKRLTQVMKNIHNKDKILNTITEDDPLKKQRIADENEKKKLKMKRQLESKRRLEEEKFERGESPSVRESSYARFARTYGDEEEGVGEEYDEEDDFVAGDEEELERYDDEEEEEEEEGEGEEDDREEDEFEKGAERLRKLKEEGQAKYRESSAEEETRKRRRIIESDEDDE
ncbi:LEO1 [Candida theae]|uniref:LEO1 n=1 Tax=Candida theae TaxID=1198502 RepID=A0AAD5FXS7_9ASCO|nr:LEO1 [Candida theae]KAI5955956.1 LEO1 [Candida theae]